MTAHVGKAIGGERHLSSPGPLDPDPRQLRMEPDHGPVQEVRGTARRWWATATCDHRRGRGVPSGDRRQ